MSAADPAERKQTVYLVLDPNLGCSARQFAAAWNAVAPSRQAPSARVETPPPSTFDPAGLGLAEIGFVVITGIATGLFTNLLYDAIKHAVGTDKPVPAQVEVEVQPLPDGSMHVTARAVQGGSITATQTVILRNPAP